MAIDRALPPTGPVADGPGGPSLRRALVVFKNRNYRYLWFSSTCGFFGMGMQQVARALLAWDLSHSFSAIGAISLAFGLPMLLFSLVGGAVADRVDKRNLTLSTQIATGVIGLVTALMITTGVMTIEWLFAIGLVQGTFFAMGMPARSPLMAMVVGPRQLLSAMALSNASMNATRLTGPAVAGLLAGTLGIAAAFYAQAAVYIFSVIFLLLVPSGLGKNLETAHKRPSMLREMGQGIRYVATDSRLRVLMLMGFILAFFGMPYMMLLAGFVQRDLGEGKEAVGLLMSASGIGALFGSLIVASITEFPRKPLVQMCAGLLGGLALAGMAAASAVFGYPGAVIGIIGLGFALNSYQTLNSAMVMEAARPEYYGRVMSMNMLTFSSMSVMAAPLGILADLVGARTLFFAQGGLIAVSMLLVSLLNPAYIFGSTAGIVFPRRERLPEAARGASSPVAAGGERAPHP